MKKERKIVIKKVKIKKLSFWKVHLKKIRNKILVKCQW